MTKTHQKTCLCVILACFVILTFVSVSPETLSFPTFHSIQNTLPKIKQLDNFDIPATKSKHFLPSSKHKYKQPISSFHGQRQRMPALQTKASPENGLVMQLYNYTKNKDFRKVDDIMTTKPIEFLPSYKNPCWIGTHDNGPIHDGRLHCLPYFYLIGVKKCGTTDLFKRILEHPNIIYPGFKETQWFAKLRFNVSVSLGLLNKLSKKGINYDRSELSFYVSLFDKAAKTITAKADLDNGPVNDYITGEGTPSNLHKSLYWEHMPGNEGLTEPKYTTLHNIKHLNPNVKIIIIFRDPVERSYSDYIHDSLKSQIKSNASAEKFHVGIETMVKNYRACFRKYSMRQCLYNFTWINDLQVETSFYMDFQAGFYAFYMQELWNVFGKDPVLPLLLTEYATNTEETLKKVFGFLNIDSLSSVNMLKDIKKQGSKRGINSHAAAKQKSGQMLQETQSILYDFFKPYNLEMSKLMEDSRYLFPKPVDVRKK